jgi:hypothetical protein
LAKIYFIVKEGIQYFKSGNEKSKFETVSPGTVNLARWVTTASSILRLYIQDSNPTIELKRLATYVMNVYAPTFFNIKLHPDLCNGVKHYCSALMAAEKFSNEHEEKVLRPVFSYNAYFAHPEIICLAALTDERRSIRKFAFKHIMQARKLRGNQTEIRKFAPPPQICFNATEYVELVDFEKLPRNFITEPTFTMHYTEQELTEFVNNRSLQIPSIPCHSQNVERVVADVTSVSLTTNSHEKRHAKLLSIFSSRASIPTNFKKTDFLF